MPVRLRASPGELDAEEGIVNMWMTQICGAMRNPIPGPMDRRAAGLAIGRQVRSDMEHNNREDIIYYLAVHGPMTAMEIERRSGICLRTVKRHLRIMVGEGSVIRTGPRTGPTPARWEIVR